MKKLIKLDFNNTTKERKTEDSYSELYSYDKNNGSFEFEILNDTLTTEQVTALFKFTESNKIWKTTGTVEGNKVNVTFDTTLITQNETVICYLYFDEEQRTSDTFRFKFKVKVSEIDKMNRYEVKERFINNTVIVDRLDVVTKEELKEALKNVGGIATEGLLTEVKAEEIYAKKTEAVDNTNFELVKNRVLALELKTDKDTVYDDREVKERLTTLENKPPVDLSGYATKEELHNISGSQPTVDNLVTKEELEAKHYISDVSDLATKEELQEVRNSQPTVDTSHLVTRDELESKGYLTEVYLNSSALAQRVSLIEEQPDKDTVYDDTEVKHRLTELENKPAVDTSFFVTEEKLNSKGYLTQHQDLSPYALKSELPTPYNDSLLNERVTALESKAIEGGAYDDTDLRNRVINLENKPPLDTSEFVTNQALESRGYIKDVSNLVTKEELNSKGYVTDEVLNSKGYLTEHQNISHLVTKDELETKGYLTQHQSLEEYAKKSELYNDTEVKQRLTALESKPNIDTSNFVTSEQLEAKNYLTSHQPLTHLATTSDLEALRNIAVSKAELSKKLDATEYNTFKDIVVTKDELAGKGYLTETAGDGKYALKSEAYNDSALVSRINVLEAKTDNDTVYDDEPIKQRLTALESRPTSQSEMRGTGMPNGLVEAPIGTTYIDIAKTNGALKWIKTTDGGNTGWKVVEGDTGWVLGWQEDKGNNTNRMYFRRKNDVVHVKFNPELNSSSISPNVNLILDIGGYDGDDNLSIDGFKPVDDVVQTIYGTSSDIYSNTAGSENSEGAQGTGVVIIQYAYNYNERKISGLKLQIATSQLGVQENHVNPFSYLTEDEWPTTLPIIGG